MSKVKPKTVAATIRLVINAGQAKPSPPVGPALGQAGLKIMDFCKDFNAKTADYKVRHHLEVSCEDMSKVMISSGAGADPCCCRPCRHVCPRTTSPYP